MAGKFGLVYGNDIYLMARQLMDYRMKHGLPCLDGPLKLMDLKQDDIRKSVTAYFHSVMKLEVILEPVHFGVIAHPDFYTMGMVCTQKHNYVFTTIAKMEWKNIGLLKCELYIENKPYWTTPAVQALEKKIDHVYVDPIRDEPPVEIDTVQVILPVVDEGKAKDVVVVDVDVPPSVSVPYVCVYPVRDYKSGFDLQKEELGYGDEEYVKEVEHVVVEVKPAAVDACLIFPRAQQIIDQNDTHEGGEFSVYVEMTGADVEGYKKMQFVGEECEHDFCVNVKPASEHPFVVRTRYRWKGYKKTIISIDNELSARARRYERRISRFIDELICDMERLSCDIKGTRLYAHNMFALKNYVMGWCMPSKDLLNQCLLMVGQSHKCNVFYVKHLEKWMPYNQFESWLDPWKAWGRSVLRSPLAIFDNYEFKYVGSPYFYDNLDPTGRIIKRERYDAAPGYMKFGDYMQMFKLYKSPLPEDVKKYVKLAAEVKFYSKHTIKWYYDVRKFIVDMTQDDMVNRYLMYLRDLDPDGDDLPPFVEDVSSDDIPPYFRGDHDENDNNDEDDNRVEGDNLYGREEILFPDENDSYYEDDPGLADRELGNDDEREDLERGFAEPGSRNF